MVKNSLNFFSGLGGNGGIGGAAGPGGLGGEGGNGMKQERVFTAKQFNRMKFSCSFFSCGTKGFKSPVYSDYAQKFSTIVCPDDECKVRKVQT